MTTRVDEFEIYALIEVKRVPGRLAFLPPLLEDLLKEKLSSWFKYRTNKVVQDEPKAQKRKSATDKVLVTELESSNSSFLVELNLNGSTWMSDKDTLAELQDELTDVLISSIARFGHFKIAIKTISIGKEL